MPWPKVPKGRPKPEGAGRKKGTPNKITFSFREELKSRNFDVAFELVKLFADPETSVSDKAALLKLVMEYSYYKPSAPKDDAPVPNLFAQNMQVAMMGKSTEQLEKEFADHHVEGLERELMEDDLD
jgi:hypothetical protein